MFANFLWFIDLSSCLSIFLKATETIVMNKYDENESKDSSVDDLKETQAWIQSFFNALCWRNLGIQNEHVIK